MNTNQRLHCFTSPSQKPGATSQSLRDLSLALLGLCFDYSLILPKYTSWLLDNVNSFWISGLGFCFVLSCLILWDKFSSTPSRSGTKIYLRRALTPSLVLPPRPGNYRCELPWIHADNFLVGHRRRH